MEIWRTRLTPCRTFFDVKLSIVLPPAEYTPLYIKLSKKATELHCLKMGTIAIAKALKIDKRTVRQAIKHGTKNYLTKTVRISDEMQSLD